MLPKLPQDISADGHEIWDWAGKLSCAVHKNNKICDLQSRINKIGTRCGDCYNWMKSTMCPKEHNIKGYSRGPSCDDYKCKDFVQTEHSIEFKAELEKELKEVTESC